MNKQQEIEKIINSEIAQNSVTEMAARIISLHKLTNAPIDECIEIYFNKIKEVVYDINDNPNVKNVLDSFITFMDAMMGGDYNGNS